LDHLHVSEARFNAVVDIAGKSKLFSVIADDLATAQQVLDINKQLKGGVINIYPIETLHMIERHESKQVPSFLQAEPLTNYVGLKPESDQRL